MEAKDLINPKSEILEPLHGVAEELSEVDRRGKAHLIEYTELDVIAATIVFTHILANKKAHQYVEITNAERFNQIVEEMKDYGNRIRILVKEMSGVELDENEKKGSTDERGKK